MFGGAVLAAVAAKSRDQQAIQSNRSSTFEESKSGDT